MHEIIANIFEPISQVYIFIGSGPKGDMWNICSTLTLYLALVMLSFLSYKKTGDNFFSFIGWGFSAYVVQKTILFIAVASMFIWKIFTPDQVEPWFPAMEHFFETIAVLMLAFAACYISLLFRGKKVKIDSSLFFPYRTKDTEVKVINYLLLIGIVTGFIGYLYVTFQWSDFFATELMRTHGKTTTFGKFWADIMVENIHFAILVSTAAYIAFRNYSLDNANNKHSITTMIIIAFLLNAIGHAFHIYNMAHGEIYNDLTDSVKRVNEFIGNFFFFGALFYRLSDRLEQKRVKLAQTLDEVREFTKACYTISDEATKSKYLDFNISLPEIKSDDELKKLHKSIKNMIDSIRMREDSLQANSQELQVVNEELSMTYEELRHLYNNQEKHINELKLTQNDLVAEKNKVDAILASIGDGLSIQDTDYNIIFTNDFYRNMFGRDIVGKKCYQLYEKKDAVCQDCPLKASFETGEVVRSVRTGFDKNKNVVHVDITASPIRDENGVIIGGIELAKDITKRIKLERQLKDNIDELNSANKKLTRMNKIKTNFIGMASHELRTPLTMIKGYSELLMLERKDKIDKVSYDMVESIYKSAENLNSIISDMLDVSRIDERKLRLQRTKRNISEVISLSLADLNHHATVRGHKISMQKPEGKESREFYFDSNRLYQVLTNLIGNAIKYTPDGGVINVTSNLIKKAELENVVHQKATLEKLREWDTDWLEIVVRDNGIGIDPSEQLPIFDRFYEIGNLNEHTTSKSDFMGGGAGLGLSICKGIVEAHGGALWVESEGYDENARKGSEFHLLLPFLTELDANMPQNELPFIEIDL